MFNLLAFVPQSRRSFLKMLITECENKGGKIVNITDPRTNDDIALITVQCRFIQEYSVGGFTTFLMREGLGMQALVEPLKTFQSLGTVPEEGQKVRTIRKLGKIKSIGVGQGYIKARAANAMGTIYEIVPGYDGKVWFVNHLPQNTLAIYTTLEMGPVLL